jgi:GH15 family glucan-1,4-alpha-glucosidase
MYKFSKNPKLNAVLTCIHEDLQALGADEVKRYKKEFPLEIDFNLAQYGNLLVYYQDIRSMYAAAGYKSLDRCSDSKAWETYKRQVGYVARIYF